MYTKEEKLCILCGEYGLAVKKFFQLTNLIGEHDNLLTVLDDNNVKDLLGTWCVQLKTAVVQNVVENFIADMARNEVTAVTWYSQNYPQQLREIDEPPYILFCRGNVDLLNKDCMSVVGTRKASSYGRRIAADFTRVLTERFVIVSGLAYGVDSIAHETALSESGETIAVLGSKAC